MAHDLLGAIELGGTKIKIATGTRNDKLVTKLVLPTAGPETAYAEIRQFFDSHPVAAIGVGAFSPVFLRPDSQNFG